MGQYYKIVNMDKKEWINPHEFGNGVKLLEFGCSGMGVMLGLAILLADGNNRGSGDLRSDNPIIGSWSGDRITIVGDYADGDLYNESETYKNISVDVLVALLDDKYIEDDFAEKKVRYCLSESLNKARKIRRNSQQVTEV